MIDLTTIEPPDTQANASPATLAAKSLNDHREALRAGKIPPTPSRLKLEAQREKRKLRRAGLRASVPDVTTRAGRIRAYTDMIAEFYKGNVRSPEALRAIQQLSNLYADQEAIAEERDAPRPEALAAWILRHALKGQAPGQYMDLRVLAMAIREALGVDYVEIRQGSRRHAAGTDRMSDPQHMVGVDNFDAPKSTNPEIIEQIEDF